MEDEGAKNKEAVDEEVQKSVDVAEEAIKRAQVAAQQIATSEGDHHDGGGVATGGSEYKESANAKKSLSDILKADNEDESLRKYKESLLGTAASGGAAGDASDPRRFYVTELRIMFDPSESKEDIVFELDTPEKLQQLKKTGIVLKEGAKYKYKISFRVQHDIVPGIKFVNKVKKMMFSEKEELVIGSHAPAADPHIFEFPRFHYSEAPSGMMYRGTYTVVNTFIDSDGTEHQKLDYELKIKSSW